MDMRSVLYQLAHPWHWLTYGQNGVVLAAGLSVLVSGLSIYVLVKTLRAVNRQAEAADRQATAAEEQSKAARAGSELARAQLWEATRERRRKKRRKNIDTSVLLSLMSAREWAEPGSPMNGAGHIYVQATAISEHTGISSTAVESSLRRLRLAGKTSRTKGTLADPAPYWRFNP